MTKLLKSDINNVEKLTIKSIFKEIWKVSLPIALQGILLSLVQLIDNLFIGHLDSATEIASGINAINNMTFNITTIVTGFMAGIGIYFAQAAGRGDHHFEKKLFITKLVWTFVWAAALLLLAILFLENIAKLWLPANTDLSVATDAAKDYGSVIFPSLFIDYFVIAIASSFREKKQTKLALYVASVAIVINSSLNYPFMYTFNWGVKGSAIATLIARCAELLIWLIYIFVKKVDFIPSWLNVRQIRFKDIFYVFPKSFWWMINGFAISLAFTLQIMFMSRLSLDAGAALNAAGVFAQLVFAFTGGYATALAIIIMHHLARYPNLKVNVYAKQLNTLSLLVGWISGFFLASVSWLIFYIYPNYNANTKIQSIIMLCSIGSTIWIGLSSSVYISLLKANGYAKMVIILDGLYSWIVILPTTLILVFFAAQMPFGFIYWIVGASGIFKPGILYSFFRKKYANFKLLINT